MGTVAAPSLLTAAGPVGALGLCCGALGERRSPLCLPKPMPEAVFQPPPSCPRPDAAHSASFPFCLSGPPHGPWHVLSIFASAPSPWQLPPV